MATIVLKAFSALLLASMLASASAQPKTADFVPDKPGLKAVNVSSDFFRFALPAPASPPNPNGFITAVTSANFRALAQQGVAVTFVNVAKCGTVPLHIHPRGTELFYVLEGTALVGFVDSTAPTAAAGGQVFRFNVLKKNEMTVFPRGTLHFTQSIDEQGFKALASFNSESPGTIFAFDALSRVPNSQLRAASGEGNSFVYEIRNGPAIERKPALDEECVSALAAGKPFDFSKGANGLPITG